MCVYIYTYMYIRGGQGIVQNGVSHAPSKTLVVWASGISVKHQLLHAQFSHHLGQLSMDIPFTQDIPELSHFHPCGADGSVNPCHQGVRLVRLALCMSRPAFCHICFNEGWVVIEANCCLSFPEQMTLSASASQSHKSHVTKGSPCFCLNCLPKSTNSAWVFGQYVVNSVTLGVPWGCSPYPGGDRLLALHFLHNWGLTDKRRPAVSPGSPSSSLLTS